MKIHTLERYIKKTAIPYGTLLERAERGGLEVARDGEHVRVSDTQGRAMDLFFESEAVYRENMDNGLIVGHYHYS